MGKGGEIVGAGACTRREERVWPRLALVFFIAKPGQEPPPFLERRYLYFYHGIDLLHVRDLITF